MNSTDAKSGRAWRPWVAAILSAAALGLPAAPTAAAPDGSNESGEAAGVGTEVLDAKASPGLPLCLKVPDDKDSYYTIKADNGRVTANDGAAVYQGQIDIVLNPTETYYINPAGTWKDAACTDPNVPATITVTSPGATSTSGVTACGSSTATYNRAGNVVRFHGHGDCTVNGAQAGTNTSHEFEGDLLPCLADDPVTCGPAQIQGVYTET